MAAMKTTAWLALVICYTAVAPALAAGEPAQAPAAVKSAIDCRKIPEDKARLACYDGAIDALGQALNQGAVVAVDHSQVQAVRRQAFGFSLPSLALFDRGAKPEALDQLTAKVARAYQAADGAWVLELEDGAVWTQTDREPIDRDPHAGSVADIRKAALGSYFLKVDGQRAFRARRTK